MRKTLHFIGMRNEEGKIGRFLMEYDDEEFDVLMKSIGGHLPKGYLVWHISEEELDKGSKRIDMLKKYPLIMTFYPFSASGGTYASAKDFMLRDLQEQKLTAEQAEERKHWLYTGEEIEEAAQARLRELNKAFNPFDLAYLREMVGPKLQAPLVKIKGDLAKEIDVAIEHIVGEASRQTATSASSEIN